MPQAMIIRPERPEDADAIYTLTRDAFAPMSFSDGSEPGIINELREMGELTLSLVAEQDDIIGHVAFSPAAISSTDGLWFGLGPISVRADCQKQGIGTKLAHTGLAQLREMGATGCVLTGNPDVYEPMGFSRDHGLTYSGLDPRYILFWSPSGIRPQGEIVFAGPLQEDHP